MKHFSIAAFCTLISSVALAVDFGVELGFRQQSGTVESTTASAKSQVGYMAGVSAFIPLHDALGLRSGLAYVQRPLMVEADSNAGDMKVNLSYFDVPVALAYKFEDYASVFGGIALAMKLEDSVSGSGVYSGTKLTDTKSMVLPLQFGASFKFAPQMGATVFFETIPGDVAKDLGGYRAVGANLMLTFD